ncbi:hypothetical protein St703_17300 [Sporolactobacillus terrae]|uniref:Uncharacterized protein n=1 Tax=Sporolactobacillus terrae TaxID=269673 RepID=A0A5K7WWT4_9BACL|nr:hypothetical protein St703_17300 [Sporolactobacillus terrae]
MILKRPRINVIPRVTLSPKQINFMTATLLAAGFPVFQSSIIAYIVTNRKENEQFY